MAEIFKFKVDYEDLIAIADKALGEKDIVKHVDYLRRALSLDPKRTEAPMKLAQTYAALEAYEISNEVIFRALDKGVNEDDRAAFFGQLAINFAELDMPEVAEYYIRDYSDEFDFSYDDSKPDARRFHLVSSNDDDDFDATIERAYELVRQHRFDDAIALLDGLELSSPTARDAANHVIIICHMLKNDLDAAIEYGERTLEKYGDSLLVGSTLASAYIMNDRQDDARKLLERFTKQVYTRVEDIMLLLPLLVNFGMHEEIADYCRKMLKIKEWQPNLMMWLSIALYNLGQKDEAIKTMRQVYALYGDYFPAKNYLALFARSPEQVEYSTSLPAEDRDEKQRKLRRILSLPADLLMTFFLDEKDPELAEGREIIEWALKDGIPEVKAMLMSKLGSDPSPQVMEFFRRMLLTADLDCEVFSTMLIALLDRPEVYVRMNVVAEDRYKELRFFKPITYYVAPEPLASALRFAVAEIAFTDEEPSYYIDKLFEIIRDLLPLDENQMPIETKRLRKIKRLRSVRTAVSVLLGKVYEEDESREDIIARYDLNATTYDKYCKIFFGDDNGED